ncbi:hypothetical protein I601_1477 [Nocardioides dokdonensis FR1436]|uniref:Lipoprotein n=1 Tax=Nocardioides dokdonensis FR1436 TaxID=1300347 RepID=A0A1A9GJX7_9ACTN|nr:hypothetical protein [Nocardioides dokdonensis]ANH37913.1 hypothetical protein I601_1477 [Nocardioides dokdonensis FR1436]
MTSWTRRAATAAVLVTTSASLVACGGDSDTGAGGDSGSASAFAEQDGAAIRDAAGDAMGDLESLRVQGDLTVDGQEISLELAASTSGDCTGTIGIDGAEAEVLSVGGESWFRPSEEFWQAQAGSQADQIIDLVDGRWVVLGEDDGFSEFCDLDELLDELVDDSDEDTTYETGETSDVDGTSAVAVVSTDEDGEVSTGFVAVDEPHHLLRIEKTEGEDPGSVVFSGFDEEVGASAPADDEIVDLDELGA